MAATDLGKLRVVCQAEKPLEHEGTSSGIQPESHPKKYLENEYQMN
jgi:hypothetical protein